MTPASTTAPIKGIERFAPFFEADRFLSAVWALHGF
jgi:hypothetical protein